MALRSTSTFYYETEGFNLSQMPDKFRSEWQRNADWMRLTFHARANDPDWVYLFARPERVREDYRLVTREIERFAGKELLSPVTTMHWGVCPRAVAQGLRAEGVRGLLSGFTSNEGLPGTCLYLPLDQWRYLQGRDYFKDTREDLLLVNIDLVVNAFSVREIPAHLEKLAADPHRSEIMELVIHEQYFYHDYKAYEPDYRARVDCAVEWVTRRGYKSVFYDEGFLGAVSRIEKSNR
jgi:hypothetical protein